MPVVAGLTACLAACLATGCVGYPDTSYGNGGIAGAGRYRPARADLRSVTAPVPGTGTAELGRLGDRPAELLRRAWILMETRQPKPAIHVLNRVMYSKPAPPADTLGLAYYLRSRAFQYRGDKVRALEDCRNARRLAQRADLRRRCDLEISRLAPRVEVARPAPRRHAGTPALTIIPRRRWNAGRPVMRRLDPMRGIRRLTIHHSAVLSSNPAARAVALQIRSIQGFHIRENGWGDIGYHFLIDPAGRIWEGRSLEHQGAHAGGANNEHNVGICLLGNFVRGRRGQNPTAEQVHTMERLVTWLGHRYSIPRRGVLTHKELKPGTICPGSRLQSVVIRMRRHLAMTTAENGGVGAPGGSR